jgi:molybdenum cofactor cytidylyltransferase
MGRAKALLPWGTGTLIEHQVQTLLKTGQPVLVILGHQPDQIPPLIEGYPVRVSVNQQWKKGMGSSIAHGIGPLKKEFPEASGVLITQLDQPLLTSAHLESMINIFQPGSRQIIVSRSVSGWEGVPVLFDRVYFEALQNLGGEGGARKIFRSRPKAVKVVECGDILEDMDTPEAYQKLLGSFNRDNITEDH